MLNVNLEGKILTKTCDNAKKTYQKIVKKLTNWQKLGNENI